jgi:putative aldouronate transport system permease protein
MSTSPMARLRQKMAKSGRAFKNNRLLHLIILPPLIWLVVFRYIPIYGLQIAFKDFQPFLGFFGSPWVGLKYFIRFFNSPLAWRIIRNTLVLSVYSLAVGFPVPIILALALNNTRSRIYKKTVQMITYAPHFISVVVLIGMMYQFFSPRYGVVNLALKAIGMEPRFFMGEPQYFRHVYVWSGIWQNMGWGTIIYLSALSAIDPELHQAAIVDGASRFQRMRFIDLPGITPTMTILFILNVGRLMNIGFEKVLLMQNALNLEYSQVIQTYVYEIGLRSPLPNFSYASAIGLFNTMINFVLLITVNKISRRLGDTSLW